MSEEEKIICCARGICCRIEQEYRQAWRDYVALRLSDLPEDERDRLARDLYRDFGHDVILGARVRSALDALRSALDALR